MHRRRGIICAKYYFYGFNLHITVIYCKKIEDCETGGKMNYLDLTKKDMEIEQTLLNFYIASKELLPEGRMTVKKINGKEYYYFIDPVTKKRKYIKQKDLNFVYELKYRRNLEEAVNTLNHNLRYQNLLLKNYKNYDPESVHERLPKTYKDVTLPFYDDFVIQPEEWSKEDYPKSKFAEGRRFKTSFGLLVRSKSELVIAEILHSYHIPFRYEERIVLYDKEGNKHYVYPDFCILTPLQERIFWEHLGMLSNADYREHNEQKFQLYFENGITIPKNLIVTMDDAEGGLDIEAITRVITGQILPLFK